MDRVIESGRWLLSGFSPPPADKIKYHGLINQGATCYLNSVLQVLFMTKEFREAVERHTSENPDSIEPLLTTLFEDLRKYKAYTHKITRKLGINSVFEQRDAAEFYEKILGLTSRETSQVFHGELTHKNICSACGTEINTDGPFWHLPLPLMESSSEDYSVVDGIEKFFSTSVVNGENQMYCEKCDDKADAALKSVITHHPDILILLLKRFEFDYRYMAYVKVNCFVDVPFTLQIPENQTYELYAVVNHFGDLRSGHYTSTIKSDDNEKWYDFNDANVSMVDFQPFQVDNTTKSQSAYLLFYRKKKMDAANTCAQDTRDTSTPGGLQLDISDDDKLHQDAVKIREKHEGGEEAAVDYVTAEAVSTHRHEEKETESKDMDSFESRQVKMMRDEEEDMGGKTGAEEQAERREVLSVETHLDENVEDQTNDNEGLDDVTQRRSQEHLAGDVGQKQYYDLTPVDVDKQGEEERKEINVKGDKEGKTGDYKLASGREMLLYEQGFNKDSTGDRNNRSVSDGKQNMSKDNQRISDMYKRHEQQREEKKGVTGEKEQERGDDEQAQRAGASQKQQHFSQGVEDQNNVGFDDRQNTPEQKISVTTHKDVGAEKQAKKQGKKGDHEHVQNREDSSRQAGLTGRERPTVNQRVGSEEKTRHVGSQPKATSGFKEDTMEVRDGTKQTKIYHGKIIEEEYTNNDSSIKRRSVKNIRIKTEETTKGRIESNVRFFKENAKRKSHPKTEPQDSLSMGVRNLDLHEAKEHGTKRPIGSVEEGNETNTVTDSNAKKLRVVPDEQAAGIKHKSKKKMFWKKRTGEKRKGKEGQKKCFVFCAGPMSESE